MRTMLLTFILALGVLQTPAQGVFFGSNVSNRTRTGSLDGALADTNIFGQFFTGPTADSLVPAGLGSWHRPGGVFFVGSVTVPGVPAYSAAFVQLVVWDAILWGTDFSAVPANQLGRTDIVQVYLTTGMFPDNLEAPHFTQPAIVPVPEPSVFALLSLGGAVAWAIWRKPSRIRRTKKRLGS